jgi:2,3-bisphosphoglycerate-dependent phosphoglycerate mutase
MSKIGRVIFIRHGESIWNVTDPSRGLITKFTGWADVPLTLRGESQAQAAGRCLAAFNIQVDAAYTSLLRRSKDTFELISTTGPTSLRHIPIINSWRMNERHYGALVGLSKSEAETMFDYESVMGWRRSWELRPPPMYD